MARSRIGDNGRVFSRRLPSDLSPNAFARTRESAGEIPFDLTVSNPTRCGFPYPRTLLRPLADPRALDYAPEPFGLASARAAAAAIHAARGTRVDPSQVVLTASSSEAYALVFKLLADPGDAVLVPAPSYPLFEHLASLEGVRAIPYRLEQPAGWQPVIGEPLPERLRAIVVVHPNNPTGTLVDARSATALAGLCAERGVALVADEVFLDYPLDPGAAASSFAGESRCLTFTLGGLSKSAGLPQLKLSWTVVSGPAPLRDAALERLEFVADQYLSVGTPVQAALAEILEGAAATREAILARCRLNLASLRRAVSEAPGVDLLVPQGGWSASLRYPAVEPEDALIERLVREDGVLVHPGYFFDFPSPGWLVVSLLPETGTFIEGTERLMARLRVAEG